MSKTHPMLKTLRDATRGLRYVSEAEATFEPFVWPGTGAAADEAAVRAKAGGAGEVARSTLVDFFRAVPMSEKGKYLTLAAALADNLADVRVFKIGDDGRVKIYVLGTTSDGKWAGVKTEAVET
jgi:hypothetical protein